MGNNQGNQKGTAQDKREHANEVQKDNSKDTSTTPTQPSPRDKGNANPGARRRGASERA
jgi:hypothetical protein